MIRFGIILGIICLTATLVLAVTYQITRPKIEERLRQEEQEALRQIIPEADFFNEKTVDKIDYFDALKRNNLIGYGIKITTNGYNGFIRLIVGIDLNGVIKGIRVIEHRETPGLGARINEIKPGEKDAWFLRQFIGKSARTIEIRKDIDAVTGATISSKAVADAVNKMVNEFLSKLKK
ncbi:MAG: RnfABCDGE type electron transport complex subunit G [Candidatus Omnitrophica bacterium]|nr:RnfABCDGE type electron transport complex subunit G [Candidatus Omnitrophota bacterium]